MKTAAVKITDKRLEALQQELEEKAQEAQALSGQLEVKEKGAAALRDQLLHLQADFENAKKRWLKAEAESQELAHGELLKQFLEIFDDFERASEAAPEADAQTLKEGIRMMSKRLEGFLKSYGVSRMEAQGKLFDPHLHEAVAHEERSDLLESTVLEELRKGYLMNGRVLRPAVVKVAVKPKEV